MQKQKQGSKSPFSVEGQACSGRVVCQATVNNQDKKQTQKIDVSQRCKHTRDALLSASKVKTPSINPILHNTMEVSESIGDDTAHVKQAKTADNVSTVVPERDSVCFESVSLVPAKDSVCFSNYLSENFSQKDSVLIDVHGHNHACKGGIHAPIYQHGPTPIAAVQQDLRHKHETNAALQQDIYQTHEAKNIMENVSHNYVTAAIQQDLCQVPQGTGTTIRIDPAGTQTPHDKTQTRSTREEALKSQSKIIKAIWPEVNADAQRLAPEFFETYNSIK